MKYLFVVLLSLVAQSSLAARILYDRITNDEGLSNSSVNVIFRDSRNYMWFGTWDGLNRYDGTNMVCYNNDPGDPNSLSSNRVRDILEQRDGILWVATDHGINRMDLDRNRIRRYYLGYESLVPSIENAYSITTASGVLVCSVYEWGLAGFSEEEDEFYPIVIPRLNTFDIRRICAGRDSQLWILTTHGLFCAPYRVKEGRISISEAQPVDLEGATARDIRRATECSVFVTTNEGRLFELFTRDGAMPRVREIPLESPSGTDRGMVGTPVYTESGNLVVPYSHGGVDTYQPQGDGFVCTDTFFQKVPVFSILATEQEMVWIGTDGMGVLKTYYDAKQFHLIGPMSQASDENLSGGIVRCFYLDGKTLYVGMKGDGLIRIEHFDTPKLRRMQPIAVENNHIFSLAKGFGEELLVGTDARGLGIYDLKSGRMQMLRGVDPAETFASIYAIYADPAGGRIWLGTSGYGLVELQVSYSNGEYRLQRVGKYMMDKTDPRAISSNIVYSIVREGDYLWLATRGGGLCRFSLSDRRFDSWQYEPDEASSINNNDLLSLTVDAVHNLWIGTSYGLNCLSLDHLERGFRSYTSRDGLPNNTVHGIVATGEQLWLSTNKGLSMLDVTTGEFCNFYRSDGLQSDEFSDGAYLLSADSSYVFMGGVKGLNYFSPHEISRRTFRPRIDITGFAISGNRVNLHDCLQMRKGRQTLVLDWNQRFFSFDLVALDYIASERCEYSYLMENFSGNWVYNGTNNRVSFTNVPAGRYQLKVRVTNGDKVWNPDPYVLDIVVRRPWWGSWTAIVFYVLLGGAIGWIIYEIIRNRLRLNQAIVLERIENRHLRTVHEAKLRFFTNITHEFSTSLSLIYAPCERLLEYCDDAYVKKYLNIIRMSVDRMLHLINDLMEFRKVETDHLKLRIEPVCLPELVGYVCDNFELLGEQKRITLTLDVPDPLMWPTDRNAMEKILFNLLSNAFKYTPEEGWITLSMRVVEDRLNIGITNSGAGIPQEKLGEIFDRFKILENIETRAAQGQLNRTGIGLALTKSLVTALGGDISVTSVEHEQTSFELFFPRLELTETSGEDSLEGASDSLERSSESSSAPDISVSEPTGAVAEPTGTTTVQKESAALQFSQAELIDNSKPIVLIVDDEATMRDLLSDTMKPYYRVLVASNGSQALEIVKMKRPSIVISDIIMPEVDGFSLVRTLKSNPLTKHIPIIFLSSKNTMEDIISGNENGVDAYVSKPFSPKYLLSVVHRILGIRSDLQDYYNSSLSQVDILDGVVVNRQDEEFLLSITGLVEANIDNEDLSPTFICDSLAISRMQLYRRIKALTGETPSEFIRNLRLKYTARLLKTTSHTVQEIMYMAGFNSKSYYYREFQKMFGVSPKKYRV